MSNFFAFIGYMVGPLGLVGASAALVAILLCTILASAWDSLVGR